jgi:hypothetical protein
MYDPPLPPPDLQRLTLGHALLRELSRRGKRKACLHAAHCRELRKIDSVQELADFFDRTRYKHVRASDDIVAVANDIVVDSEVPRLWSDPAILGLVFGIWGVLTLPALLMWRAIWRDRDA